MEKDKKIEFFITDLKPEKQKQLKEFLGGDNRDLDKTPFCILKAEYDVNQNDTRG